MLDYESNWSLICGKHCYFITGFIFTNLFGPILLCSGALTAHIGHEPIECLFRMTNKLIEGLKIRWVDVFQHTSIDQSSQCFVELTACNRVVMQAVKIMVTSICLGDVTCDIL